MNYEYRPSSVTSKDLEQVSGLLKRVWPKASRLNFKYIEWLYRQNPSGAAMGFNAFHSDQIVGHYAVIPFSANLRGQTVPAALSLNTAVDAGHRGQGLFKKLAEMTYALAAQSGVQHILGVANANSTPGFVRSLGFQSLGPLEVRLLCGRPRLPEHLNCEWRRHWSAESLHWRLTSPDSNYWYEREEKQLCVLGRTKYPGLIGVLKVETEGVLRNVEEHTLPQGRTWRPRLWFGKTPKIEMPFSLSFPRRLRPSPFNLIFRDLTGRGLLLNSEAVHFEAIDFDVM